MDWTNGEYLLTDDPARLDLERVHELLENTYWGSQRPRALTEKAIRRSVCLSLLHCGQQVGFARAITDQATFAWICDVVIHPAHQGQGLGKWMTGCLLAHPDLQTTTHALRTRDAHGLYEQFGFQRVECMRRSANPP